MKVNIQMLAKDLRLTGVIYRLFGGFIPKKRTVRKKQKRAQTHTASSMRNVNIYVSRTDGSNLRLYVKQPKNKAPNNPGVLWLHGGGYAWGMPEMAYISMAKHIAKTCTIVCPAYRLSTEKPYPAALEDSYQALLWMVAHASELGIRDDQIFVGGESAGGGLTAALCLYARDKGEVNIACQMPLYPMLDDRMQTASMQNNNAPVWNARQNAAAWSLYLDGLDAAKISEYAAPARANDYSGLPPAITFVGSIEPFFDETATYVKNLEANGVPVAFKVYDGCFHGFDMLAPWSKSAKDANVFFMNCFENACAHYSATQPEKSHIKL